MMPISITVIIFLHEILHALEFRHKHVMSCIRNDPKAGD